MLYDTLYYYKVIQVYKVMKKLIPKLILISSNLHELSSAFIDMILYLIVKRYRSCMRTIN